ncbi:MAG: STAS domain-containing protein [Phycisphaerales bacterium JB058]|jgi:anti-anti-sigma factor
MLTDWSDDIVVVDLADDPQLSDELTAIIDRVAEAETDQVPHVVLNMGLVAYIKSSNLAQLIRLRKLLHEVKRELLLCSVDDRVWSVMMVTGLDKLFNVAPDPMTALASIQLGDSDSDADAEATR